MCKILVASGPEQGARLIADRLRLGKVSRAFDVLHPMDGAHLRHSVVVQAVEDVVSEVFETVSALGLNTPEADRLFARLEEFLWYPMTQKFVSTEVQGTLCLMRAARAAADGDDEATQDLRGHAHEFLDAEEILVCTEVHRLSFVVQPPLDLMSPRSRLGFASV